MPLPVGSISAEEVACKAWPAAVGKRLAAHTRARRVWWARTKLVVHVEDAVWQKQLFCLSRQILRNLIRILGPGLVDDVEFRVIPRRIEPQRAATTLPLFDDANGIEDPVLRGIYKYRTAARRTPANRTGRGSSRLIMSHSGWNWNHPFKPPATLSRVSRAHSWSICTGLPTDSARNCAWQLRSMVTNHHAASSTDIVPSRSAVPMVAENHAAFLAYRLRRCGRPPPARRQRRCSR